MKLYWYVKQNGRKIVNVNKPIKSNVYFNNKKTIVDWYCGTLGEIVGIELKSSELDIYFKNDEIIITDMDDNIRDLIIKNTKNVERLKVINWIYKK